MDSEYARFQLRLRSRAITARYWLILLSLWLVPPNSYMQEFPCDGAFYFISTSRQEMSRLFRLELSGSELDIQQLPLDNTARRHITCLGYNVKDQRLYGLDFDSYELLRIDANGKIESLGVPDNLDTTFHYYAGEMTPDGRRLVVLARNPLTDEDERIYSIRVNNPPDYYAGFFSVIADVPVRLTDIAVDPVVGVTYGFDARNGQLVETDRTGLTSSNHRPFAKLSQEFGSLFFDREGQLFGVGGGNQGDLFSISKLDGQAELLNSVTGGFDSDGAGCPYTVKFFKDITPREIAGCQQIEIKYEVINHAGIGQVGIRITDRLYQEFVIQDIILRDLFNVQISSGVGSNLLDLDRWTLLLGSNQLTLVIEVTSADPISISSQAWLDQLPQALGSKLPSDDPFTSLLLDPTKAQIKGVEGIHLKDYREFSCDLDTTYLSLPLQGDYQWSTGAVSPTIAVNKPGLYEVTVTSPCIQYTDSIWITKEQEPFYVDLGPDRKLNLGDTLRLPFNTNMTEISGISWETSEPEALACTNCISNVFTANHDARVILTIADDRGCTVTDELLIEVDDAKRIYVPNSFTPNGDQINDFFMPLGRVGKVTEFQIFDRWGRLVFESQDFQLGDDSFAWDGVVGSSVVNEGVYVWKLNIDFPDGVTQQLYGQVLVLR